MDEEWRTQSAGAAGLKGDERREIADVIEGQIQLLQSWKSAEPVKLAQPAAAQPQDLQLPERRSQLADRRQRRA